MEYLPWIFAIIILTYSLYEQRKKDQLLKRLRRLRDALEPFAEEALRAQKNPPDYGAIYIYRAGEHQITGLELTHLEEAYRSLREDLRLRDENDE